MSSDYGDLSNTTTMRWLPEPRVAPLASAIKERTEQFGSLIRNANFPEFIDPLMQRLIVDCFRDAKAHEGVIWLMDSEKKYMMSAWQVGPRSERLLNTRLALDAGIAGMVLVMQQPFCENNLSANRAGASKLEEKLGAIVCSRILVPFYIAGRMRGLVACYRTKTSPDDPDPADFQAEELEEMSLLSRLLSRLLDYKLLCTATGVDED